MAAKSYDDFNHFPFDDEFMNSHNQSSIFQIVNIIYYFSVIYLLIDSRVSLTY
jgi:hypothetical protein